MSDAVVVTDRGAVVVADDVRAEEDTPTVEVERWARLAAGVLADSGAAGELTLTFVDRSEIAELNAEYMGKEGPTDVLSFPLDDPADPLDPLAHAGWDTNGDGPDDPRTDDRRGTGADGPEGGAVPVLLGDVVLSPAVAEAQFGDHAGTLDDEIALLVVHGVLHVLGHDHAEPDETATMRAGELELLERLHWNGPAPDGFRQHHSD